VNPDDARHGTHAGALAHYREGGKPCGPCGVAPTLQRRLYEVERDAGWGETTIGEECAHLHEEVSEAFRAWRQFKDGAVRFEAGKPIGVPAELADVVIGCFYIAETLGFDLLLAVEQKSLYNRSRNYESEGRQLHPTRVTSPEVGQP